MTCKRIDTQPTGFGSETTAFFGLVLDVKTFNDVLTWTERHGIDKDGDTHESEAFIRAAICEKLRSKPNDVTFTQEFDKDGEPMLGIHNFPLGDSV